MVREGFFFNQLKGDLIMLGRLQKRQNDQGKLQIFGHIATYSLLADLFLEPNADRKDDRSPSHNIMIKGKHGGWAYAGAAWEGNHPQHGAYISMTLEVPELFDKPLNLMAGTTNEVGTFIIRHSKDKEEKQQKAA